MGLIIDVCVFNDFFTHLFCPIARESIDRSNGPKILCGGSRYKKELGENRLDVLVEFSKLNKLKYLDDNAVDNAEKQFEAYKSKDFDDPHIAAMVLISGCRIIVTKDMRMRELKKHFKGKYVPILYTNDENCKQVLFNKVYRIT